MNSTPHTPIQLDDPNRAIDARVLDTPGAFVWWYVDAVDEHGDGVVLIWSFGLPFLPDVLTRARNGAPLTPRERPALNVVGYENGEEAFYLLQTYAEATWRGDTFTFGDSHIAVHRDAGAHHVRATLDCPIYRSTHRLRGTIELVGPAAHTTHAPTTPHPHRWTPLTGPAHLRAELEHGEHRFHFEGAGYHDRNVGTQPLDTLGIERWTWGRTVAERTSIHYVLWGEEDTPSIAWLVDVDDGGAITLLPASSHEEPNGAPKRLYGMPHPPRTELYTPSGSVVELRERSVVDEGPFYLRTMLERDGRVGVAEHVVPSRIDRALHRPLVRMRVHEATRPCSMWHPLFSGPTRGRVRRLFGLETSA
ncbi:MAG: hypothetical protein RIT81_10325 [Deltaproteobacteria bacterium]